MLVLVTGTVNLADILTKAQALAVFTTLMQAFDVLRTFLVGKVAAAGSAAEPGRANSRRGRRGRRAP